MIKNYLVRFNAWSNFFYLLEQNGQPVTFKGLASVVFAFFGEPNYVQVA